MSIPPFVSTTPPPPDQCDDDKEADDYEIAYHLSQEDYEDINNLETLSPSFSNFNHNINIVNSNHTTNNVIHHPKVRIDEDNNIEDLEFNLKGVKLEDRITHTVDYINNKIPNDLHGKESVCNVGLEDKKNDETINVDNHEEVFIKQSVNNIILDENGKETVEADLLDDDDISKEISIDYNESIKCSILDANSDIDTFHFEPTNINLEAEVLHDLGLTERFNVNEIVSDCARGDVASKEIDNVIVEDGDDDKFDEFVDFQAAKVDETPESRNELQVDDTQNKLQANQEGVGNNSSIEVNESFVEDDFGDFDAFRNKERKNSEALQPITQNLESWSTHEDDNFGNFEANFEEATSSQNKTCESLVTNNDDDFDDFNDFSTFKSSENELNIDSSVSKFNIENESELIQKADELFCQSLNTLNVVDYDSVKLDYRLGIVWRGLMEIEERQPYMITWSKTFGRELLLKALAIDVQKMLSLNEVNPHMPRYAANLSTAPLEPVKSQHVTAAVLPGNKIPTELVDQKNGKKAQSVERAQSLQPELIANKQTVSSKSFDKMPNITQQTTHVAPVRQINLPDTHIFTPSDSETPRSQKIIHPVTKTSSESDFSDFQDFQGSSSTLHIKTAEDSKVEKGNDKFNSCSILEPVKLEPTNPVIKWPEPGHVSTAQDFSDFIKEPIKEVKHKSDPEIVESNKNTNMSQLEMEINDDFDNFQSAPLAKQEIANFSLNGVVTVPKQPQYNITELQPTKVSYPSLQQTKVSDKNSQQILQPLSLESFSTINWPSPGLDIQDLSRFNPVNALPNFKNITSGTNSKKSSPIHSKKQDDDWSDFVSIGPSSSQNQTSEFDDWSDFVSSTPQTNGLNTISLNVSSTQQKKSTVKSKTNKSVINDIPNLNFITPKSNSAVRMQNTLFQNL